MKFIVTKKCYADEFIAVEAETKAEALRLASKGQGKQMCVSLAWHGYRPVSTWEVDRMDSAAVQKPKTKKEN